MPKGNPTPNKTRILSAIARGYSTRDMIVARSGRMSKGMFDAIISECIAAGLVVECKGRYTAPGLAVLTRRGQCVGLYRVVKVYQ